MQSHATGAGRLTTHVLDTVRGKPADRLRIDLYRIEDETAHRLKSVDTNDDGRCDQPLLSDEAMPYMTGSELVAHIRAIRPDVPIVLMSGFVTTGLAARARDAGVAEVLAKPLVSRDIARSLANALRR